MLLLFTWFGVLVSVVFWDVPFSCFSLFVFCFFLLILRARYPISQPLSTYYVDKSRSYILIFALFDEQVFNSLSEPKAYDLNQKPTMQQITASEICLRDSSSLSRSQHHIIHIIIPVLLYSQILNGRWKGSSPGILFYKVTWPRCNICDPTGVFS